MASILQLIQNGFGAVKDSGGLRNIYGSLISKYTGNSLTGAEREANQFSAQQAQLSRDWDEMMYNQYNSPSALVRQYQEAGINPALMFGGQTPAAPTSSGEPSSVSPTSGFDFVRTLLDLAGFKANIDNIKADTKQKEVETSGKEIENQFKPAIFEQNLRKGEIEIGNLSAGIDKIRADIAHIASDIDLAKSAARVNESTVALNVVRGALAAAQTSVANAQSDYISAQTAEQNWRNDFEQKWGYRPEADILGVSWDVMSSASDFVAGKLGNVFNLVKDKIFPSGKNAPTLVGILTDLGLDDKTILGHLETLGFKLRDGWQNIKAKTLVDFINAGSKARDWIGYITDYVVY